ncbi:hypothetical protein [Enterovirga rhinocerotis]|uniref:Uncharacterized protein n=1 Tax=Enterovirga rhinocerotis TaxID=1339210 RepID=A0A4R7BJA3_9HYPH|nr:hypothetical protein [Enterovirga rhinocerotis]TDR85450.1 hypothetical protein EV668_4572 [Enterovirga rhinocerotis]
MKNLTLAIEDHVLDEARQIAARRRTTVNAIVRDFLTRIVAEESRIEEARRGLIDLMDNSTAQLGADYAWNREDAYEERLRPRHEHPDLRGGRSRG